MRIEVTPKPIAIEVTPKPIVIQLDTDAVLQTIMDELVAAYARRNADQAAAGAISPATASIRDGQVGYFAEWVASPDVRRWLPPAAADLRFEFEA